MNAFYFYVASVVGLTVIAIIGAAVYTFLIKPRSPGNDSGLVTIVALGGPAVAIHLIAFGWVAQTFWRKFSQHDTTLSATTFWIAVVLLLLLLQSTYQGYKTFIRPK